MNSPLGNMSTVNDKLLSTFKNFVRNITWAKKKPYKVLDPVNGVLPRLIGASSHHRKILEDALGFNDQNFEEATEATKHFTSMGIVANTAAFEAYFQNLFLDTFDLITENKPIGEIENLWPAFKETFQNYLSGKKSKEMIQFTYDFLKTSQVADIPTTNVLMAEFRENRIKGSVSNPDAKNVKKALGLFLGDQTEKYVDAVMSNDKLDNNSWYLQFDDDDKNEFCRYLVKIKTSHCLEVFLDLFYGLRCISAHGITDFTVMTGVFSRDITVGEIALDVVEEKRKSRANVDAATLCKEYIVSMWTKAKRGTVHIDYHAYLNSLNFYMFVARALMRVSGCLVHGDKAKNNPDSGEKYCGMECSDIVRINENVFNKDQKRPREKKIKK